MVPEGHETEPPPKRRRELASLVSLDACGLVLASRYPWSHQQSSGQQLITATS